MNNKCNTPFGTSFSITSFPYTVTKAGIFIARINPTTVNGGSMNFTIRYNESFAIAVGTSSINGEGTSCSAPVTVGCVITKIHETGVSGLYAYIFPFSSQI